ncbi:NADPH2:quinone reductase [Maritimibacter alkaliphilus HTCC2654]|uniref:NADPH:quinone oxidoreductase family protein n=1 Tax=Maritimibacter TaxID=404235 RepID=UPI0003215D55|nr:MULTISPECIES: NADPH:quinone oxidoreductase family protein [Maritimibacter]MBL6428709.1 NADPH:quinone oxidoreductase family protein [Maritimibacter sp.]TYP85480.1 NADPH2:quinone reductase [Maritimibacter alkaliphilus HTCC2654]
MRAYQVVSYDKNPELVETNSPTPVNGEILLEISACGLNFGDLLMAKGQYQEKPDLPFTLGMEVAGTIREVGEGVEGFEPGMRVLVGGGSGGLADFGTFPATKAIRIPDSMSFTDAAAFQVAYGTSHVGLDYRARLQPGENLLVLGAAGGVGMTAIEIGKLMGAKVIACARGKEKLEVCKSAGADVLIDSETDDLREAVKAAGGADVIYDPVGGDQFRAAMRATNPEARILVVGFASGDIPQIPANHLLVKNLNIMGYYWGGYNRFKPEVLTNSMATLIRWYDEGKLKPHVGATLPLEQAGDAYELMRSRKSTGKVVVTTGRG